MTKTNEKTAAPAFFASMQQAFENIQGKLEVPAAALDIVKRTASSAKDGADTVHARAADATHAAEKFALSVVGNYATFTRGLMDATLANVQHALSTFEKVAGAQSINEAVQIQTDFVRENARANFDRVRIAADTAKSVVTEGAESAQAEFSKFYGQQAA